MRQILQNLGSGETILAEVPAPGVRSGCLLVETEFSLVSLGTEKMLVDFARSGWLTKASKQPEKVKQVLQKVKTDGLFPTLEAVRTKLDEPIALGYCNAGRVVAVGAGVQGYNVGDRVASNGPHAELVCVPENLCAKIPETVTSSDAAFTILASIALQGIRLLNPTLSERIAVTGLGLIGLVAVQLLQANGCRVLGIDIDPEKCALAREFGAETVNLSVGEDPLAIAKEWTKGQGVDGVLITASTPSSEPVSQAARMCRKRGRIVLVGVAGLALKRAEFYEKELSFQVSCSYGPGRYDDVYEQEGNDYPLGFVRWTEQRNFTAILDLLAAQKLNLSRLISHRFDFDKSLEAYSVVATGKAMGILLAYASTGEAKFSRTKMLFSKAEARSENGVCPVVVGFLGAGNFTGRILLPTLHKLPVHLHTIVSNGGVAGTHLAKKFGFLASSTDPESVLSEEAINLVFVTTRHNAHARQVIAALGAGKHVFVEKPLCLTLDELKEIQAVAEARPKQLLMLGFNRRFSPHIQTLKRELTAMRGPKSFVFTANAGAIPESHWTQNLMLGGGRIVGEACHYLDLLRHLVGAPVAKASIHYLGGEEGRTRDTATIQLMFCDGSIGTVHYFANGDKGFPKETLQVFAAGKIFTVDNFRKTLGFGTRKHKLCSGWQQDKGHAAELVALMEAVATGNPSPVPLDEIIEISRLSILLAGGTGNERNVDCDAEK
ncbi:MAG: bi-domain-containing oxidoreductase [Puniceicoccales bacterium]|jgi:predicted dehydrogenase|nr:bi-domain-containing oxidoreductase [Puniceicoccales bacterium]